ncbi:MAG: bifunctional diaminohydroxyphosphoribosylaminopyrimidine deaminase/5-amino-6-(5-phosphoribosylamino)uracil reductase RibD, partial [Gammaproteobacteria bacterium]|nr:bifunctional diaminohydroxyphosphoribosylaminopyrimidine deaminase/5-amino-6-(5-phosphoribosylamino)uracil reductase RibD [Gammaproteobacteria bacterium]
MRRALALAALGARTTQPNPRVGCVIAREGVIVGEGWHQRAGEPHAEVFALRAAGQLARGATAFVTLEPCNHHGRTPPCTEALINAGIARVIFACGDPNPRVDGSGAARLRAAGIAVEVGLRATEGEELNRGFFKRMRTGRPWLRLKLAASIDGRTALAHGESQWITSPAARADVHRFRAESAAILSTSATVLADDPQLDARSYGGASPPSRQPMRVLLDRRLRIPPRARVFATGGEVVRLASAATQSIPAPAMASPQGRIEHITLGGDGQLNLEAVLAWMGGAALNEVWTECGPTLAGALLDRGLVDEMVLYLAPKLLGSAAKPLVEMAGPARLAEAMTWQVHDLQQIGPDIRIMLRRD